MSRIQQRLLERMQDGWRLAPSDGVLRLRRGSQCLRVRPETVVALLHVGILAENPDGSYRRETP